MLLIVDKRTGMWGYGELWFTYADKEPQDINLDELDVVTRDKVNQAIAQGKLVKVDTEGNIIRVPNEPRRPIPNPVVSSPVVEDPVLQGLPPVLVRKLTDLLKSGVTTLRKEIPLLKGYQMLNAALHIERNNKNRKTVIELLEKRLVEGGNTNAYIDLIEEEDIETVTFNIEDLVVESEEEEVALNIEE